MKNFITLILLSFFFQLSYSQNPNFEWAKRIGNNLLERPKAISADAKGNIYITGTFNGTVDFDSGSGITNLIAPPMGSTIFVAKFDSSGNLKWAKQMGGKGQAYTYSLAIATDTKGNVYTTGYFTDSIDFDPGIDSFFLIPNYTYSNEVFISKLDSLGNFVWAKKFGGNSSSEGNSICLDSLSNIYLTGSFVGTFDFDPNIGIFNLTTIGNRDIFVCKLDSSGQFIWAKQMGGKQIDISNSIAIANHGSIYITGSFKDTCDFDPGIGSFKLISFGKEDIFIVKLNLNGEFIFAKQAGGNDMDIGVSIMLDDFGNIFCSGGFYDIADFNPSAGNHKITSAGKMDFFISKFDTSGNFKWVVKIGGDSNDISNSIAIDMHGSVYCTGRFEDTVNFNPGGASNNFISAGYVDAFVTKTDSTGMMKWVKQIGGTWEDAGWGILADRLGNVITFGIFTYTVDLDPGIGIFNQTSTGSSPDLFIQKMKQCSNSYATISLIGCDSIVVNSQTYKVAGTYFQTKSNYKGCDSLITLNINIKNSTFGIKYESSCDSIRINGVKYVSSGTYKQKLINVVGCDSTVTLYITINSGTISNTNISSCEPYLFNNQLYSSSGIYYQKLINSKGCDSTLKLVLTIQNIDTSVSISGKILTANASNATYQWWNCNTNLAISGETNQDFDPTSNGSYSVIITKNSCTDTSSCHLISGVGIKSDYESTSINIFPNPIQNKFTIQFPSAFELENILVYDGIGREIKLNYRLVDGLVELNLEKYPSGRYIILINDSKGNKWVKEIVKKQ